ncbi:hypothetical protein B0H13DRAFT_2371579 [Mycena leptocephala]|nr:hypothetical protein B0H13DRAFT_2371579 [Mycena leptocephala]
MQSKYNKEVLLAHVTEPTLEDVTSLLSASAADPGIKQEDDRISSTTLVAALTPATLIFPLRLDFIRLPRLCCSCFAIRAAGLRCSASHFALPFRHFSTSCPLYTSHTSSTDLFASLHPASLTLLVFDCCLADFAHTRLPCLARLALRTSVLPFLCIAPALHLTRFLR